MKAAEFEPVSRASVPRLTAILIVCGDCGGDALVPLKTFMTDAGTCSRCGGGSFALAAKINSALVRHIHQQRQGEI